MKARLSVAGSTAIVVGASGGIGSATVQALAAAGVHLVLAALADETQVLDRLAAGARDCGVRALIVPTDITNRSDVDRLIRAALDAYGSIDILVNLAGIGSSPSLADDDDAQIERVLAVNLLGCARTMHAVMPVMKAQRRGAIVNIGSIAGEVGVMGIYSASKFGLRGLTDTVRRELRSYNVGVTLIEPGFVRTSMNAAMGDGLPSPAIVADAILVAIQRPRRRQIVPWYYVLPVAVAKVFPGLFDLVFGDARIQDRLNRDARAARAAAREAATSK